MPKMKYSPRNSHSIFYPNRDPNSSREEQYEVRLPQLQTHYCTTNKNKIYMAEKARAGPLPLPRQSPTKEPQS